MAESASIHIKVDDVKLHIKKLGSPHLTGLVAWYFTVLLDSGTHKDIIEMADELLQIPVPEGKNAS